MIHLELNYCSWERQECYGMFDHSQTKMIRNHPSLIIKNSGLLLRHIESFDLIFCEGKIKKPSNMAEYETFLQIEEKDGHYFLIDIKEKQDQLCKIVPVSQKGFEIHEKHKIRLGKIHMQVVNEFWKKNTINHYQEIAKPKIGPNRSVFTPSFYSGRQNASMVETNPSCRYCYSKSIDENNPFVAICNCSGYTKYIHKQCLIEWVKKRNQKIQQSKQNIFYAYSKAFTCELCNSFYRIDKLFKQVFSINQSDFNQYIILYINSQVGMLYVVDLTKMKEIIVGRSLESDIIVNELSVSRKHCKLMIDRVKKQVKLVDLSAKFGTVVKINKQQILDKGQFQKGRTKLVFKKIKKISFFEKFGLCSWEQNLSNQGIQR